MERPEITILDGATGTMLQAAGLPLGELPEVWNITHPDAVTAINRQYVDAGSDVIYTNTFGANRLKAAKSGHTVQELVAAGVRCAKKAAEGTGTRVALDVGPIGQLLEPLGTLSFDEAYDIFRETVTAGAAAGADLVIFETMSDLYEAKAAVLAAKENTELPVWVTMTFEATGRTFVGTTVPAMALTLTGLGADALGFNCSLGPRELLPMTEELRKWTDKPLILKPNAGLPDPATGAYTITPEDFVREIAQATELGVHIFGGCCGTGPDYIAALNRAFAGGESADKQPQSRFGVCSASCVVELDEEITLGTTISPDNPEVIEALEDKDFDALGELAMDDLDEDCVQIWLPAEHEDKLAQTVQAVQAMVSRPLVLRAASAEMLEKAVRVYNGRPAVVADTKENEEICRRYGAQAVTTENGTVMF